METKICKKCGRELPIEEFYKAKGCKDGYRNECKECFLQYQKQYQQEHKEELVEYNKQYRQNNKEAIAEQRKQYYQEHKEERSEYDKQYYQSNKEERLEWQKQYYQDNREYIAELRKQYNQDNKEVILEYKKQYNKQYNQTPIGRAINFVKNYKWSDKKYNRGECTLTPEWIIDNIFTKPCHWCGETDWHKLGCDRINNSLPHTPDNVIPCCEECNKKRGKKTYEEFLLMI